MPCIFIIKYLLFIPTNAYTYNLYTYIVQNYIANAPTYFGETASSSGSLYIVFVYVITLANTITNLPEDGAETCRSVCNII